MKVALFFDGKNFYKAFERYENYNPNAEIDYNKLAAWLTNEVSGETGDLIGAYYYTGYTPPNKGGSPEFRDFLDGLELLTGYLVKREERVKRNATCTKCGSRYEYRTEKRVDTQLVADMIQLAAVNAYDAAVLLSGDQDFVPAVKATNDLGKRVYIAAWPGSGVSKALRALCYGQIDLKDGFDRFSMGLVRAARPTSDTLPPREDQQANMMREIERALEYHEYLSRGHFINKWRPQLGIPESGADREEMLTSLIREGRVIEDIREQDGRSFNILNLPTQ